MYVYACNVHICMIYLREGVFTIQGHIVDELSWNKYYGDPNVLQSTAMTCKLAKEKWQADSHDSKE